MNLKSLLAIVVGLAIGAFAVFERGTEREEIVELVAGASRLQSEFGPTLSDDAMQAYRDWSRKPAHFGAFAATEFGDYGWVSEYNSIEAAETAALAFCGVPDCRVFARSLPLRQAGEGELVVSQATKDAFDEFLALRNAKAFAVHGNGAGGSWVGAPSLASAITGALKECKSMSRQTETAIPYSEAIEDCRIVYAER